MTFDFCLKFFAKIQHRESALDVFDCLSWFWMFNVVFC